MASAYEATRNLKDAITAYRAAVGASPNARQVLKALDAVESRISEVDHVKPGPEPDLGRQIRSALGLATDAVERMYPTSLKEAGEETRRLFAKRDKTASY
jgi:hypothetical protein